ncbi:MAG: hypothetical protein Q8Q14_02210 [Gemmatimonadales bacterium]|nr:hypothetical protein [Gemmatimonadales bacterium]
MATLERESSSLKRQLDGAAAKTERVQLGDPKHATELRAILAELMFTAVALEIVHRASEVGAFFAKPFAKKPSAESDRQVQDAYHLAGMALLLPTLSKGACGYDSQNRLRGCRRRARPGESHR